MNLDAIESLLVDGVRVVSIGIDDFAKDIESQDAPVVQLDWTPPVDLGHDLNKLLDELL